MGDFFDERPHGDEPGDGDPGFWGEKRSRRSERARDAGGAREQRRAAARRRARHQRRIALLIVVGLVVAIAAGFVIVPLVRGDETDDLAAAKNAPAAGATGAATVASAAGAADAATVAAAPPADPTSPPTPKPTSTPKPPDKTYTESPTPPTPSPTPTTVPRPVIVRDYVPYGSARKQQMAGYSKRHYGAATWVLNPKAIVLHYTAGGSYSSAHNYFSSNAPNRGELPGVCSHFIIDKDGTIYQQLPLGVRCRHTIGLNYVAVGIEFVQEAGSGPTWATNQIFKRTKQINAGLRLVRWLKWKYAMPVKNILGHGTANASPLFKDLKGWRNDHVDWNAASVTRFKAKLAAMK